MSKYSYEFKLHIVNEYLSGNGSETYLMNKHKIHYESLIFDWVNAYEQYGIDGLKHKTTKQKYTGDFKLRIIQYRQNRQNNRLSYRETANHFKITRGSTIANWEAK